MHRCEVEQAGRTDFKGINGGSRGNWGNRGNGGSRGNREKDIEKDDS